MTVTKLIAVLGLISGAIGTDLGLLNFFRDRAAVEVSLQWDTSVTPGTECDVNKKWGIITIANIGRRPIFVSHAALRIPDKSAKGGYTYFVIATGINGKSLTEGSPVERHVVTQEAPGRYAAQGRHIIARVNDATVREWKKNCVVISNRHERNR